MMRKLRELYQYREMIVSLVRKDLKGRYKGSALGFLWTFLNPLLQLLVYTVVFSVILKSGIPNYYLHLFVALVPWIYFASALTTGAKLVLDQKNMIKKIWFPREVLPLAYSISGFCNMLFSFVIIFAVIGVMRLGVNFAALPWLIPVMLIQFVLVLGINLITSAVTVYVRDLEHIMGVISMAWMYLSPVVYGISYVPESWHRWYLLNPIAPLLLAYRDILYYQTAPALHQLFPAAVISFAVLAVGFLTFSRLQRRFAEEL